MIMSAVSESDTDNRRDDEWSSVSPESKQNFEVYLTLFYGIEMI